MYLSSSALFALIPALSFALPCQISQRQDTPAACAPSPFEITGFTTFSGTSAVPAAISFRLNNFNPGGDSPMGCSHSFDLGSGLTSNSYYVCDHEGTYFQYSQQGSLTAWQRMVCGGSDGGVVIAFANGTIPVFCYSGANGGKYCEMPTGYDSIPVTSVQA